MIRNAAPVRATSPTPRRDESPRVRFVLTPVDPSSGERRAGAIYVYTWRDRRTRVMLRRFDRQNRGSRFLRTREGYMRYEMHLMDEAYYQNYVLAHSASMMGHSQICHLGQVYAPFLPRECPENALPLIDEESVQ